MTGSPKKDDAGSGKSIEQKEAELRDLAIFAKDMRVLYEEDVEDAVRELGSSAEEAELLVLHGYLVFLHYARIEKEIEAKFYKKRKASFASESMARVRGIHRMTIDWHALLASAPLSSRSTLALDAIELFAARLWGENKEFIEHLRLPISEGVRKRLDAKFTELGTMAVESLKKILLAMGKQAGKK